MAGGAEIIAEIIDVDRLQHEDIRSRRLAAAGERSRNSDADSQKRKA
jgi:hypothetical protein